MWQQALSRRHKVAAHKPSLHRRYRASTSKPYVEKCLDVSTGARLSWKYLLPTRTILTRYLPGYSFVSAMGNGERRMQERYPFVTGGLIVIGANDVRSNSAEPL